MGDLKSNLYSLQIAHFYYDAVRKLILRMQENGTLPDKEPKIEDGTQKSISDRKWKQYLDYHFFRQMLNDTWLIDAYLLEQPIAMKYGTREEKGKKFLTVRFYVKK